MNRDFYLFDFFLEEGKLPDTAFDRLDFSIAAIEQLQVSPTRCAGDTGHLRNEGLTQSD